jgi:hydroxyacylglutathione hydrolase
MENGAVLVDTNMPVSFASAHIEGALSISAGLLPGWAGWFLPYDRPLLLVLPDGGVLETVVTYLYRLGYDKIVGYLVGGMESWYGSGLPFERVPVISVQELKEAMDRQDNLKVLDVRKDDEWDEGHIPGAEHIFLGHLPQEIDRLNPDVPIAVHCAIGNRSSVAASILQQAGFRVSNVIGSMRAWRGAGFPVVSAAEDARLTGGAGNAGRTG